MNPAPIACKRTAVIISYLCARHIKKPERENDKCDEFRSDGSGDVASDLDSHSNSLFESYMLLSNYFARLELYNHIDKTV